MSGRYQDASPSMQRLADAHGWVHPEFSPGAINAVNASFYASDLAFHEQYGAPPYLSANQPLNLALGATAALDFASPGEAVWLKEVCSGPAYRWSDVALGAVAAGAPGVIAEASDFVPRPLLATTPPELQLTSSILDIQQPLAWLPPAERVHVLFGTYACDSVWQDQDQRLLRGPGMWYEAAYRVKTGSRHRRRNDMLQALRQAAPLDQPRARDYRDLTIEVNHLPIKLAGHPYERYLRQWPQGQAVNVPGGMIAQTVAALDKQVRPGGAVIWADIGHFGFRQRFSVLSSATTGSGGQYKVEDYVLAKDILEGSHKLRATIYSLSGFIDQAAKRIALPINPSAYKDLQGDTEHGVLVVTRPS